MFRGTHRTHRVYTLIGLRFLVWKINAFSWFVVYYSCYDTHTNCRIILVKKWNEVILCPINYSNNKFPINVYLITLVVSVILSWFNKHNSINFFKKFLYLRNHRIFLTKFLESENRFSVAKTTVNGALNMSSSCVAISLSSSRTSPT